MNSEKHFSSEENAIDFESVQSKLLRTEQDQCIFKKCCEKYKKGKRCKKCPLR